MTKKMPSKPAPMSIKESRPTELQQISDWFDTGNTQGGIDIYGISGYGGIGKSYLLDHAIKRIKPRAKGYLHIHVDGSDSSILGDMVAILDRRLAPKSVPGAKPGYDHFPHSRRLVREHAKLENKVNEAVKESGLSKDVQKAAQWIFRGGSVLNQHIPKTKEFLDFESLVKSGVDKHVDQAIELLASLGELRSGSWLPGPIRDFLRLSYSDRIKADLYRLAGEEWVADVGAIFGKHQRSGRGRLAHEPIKGLERLLLVLDDFEILGKTTIHFITTSLIPQLEQSGFHTTIIVAGRDDLFDAHIEFMHHLHHFVRDRIRLEKLSEDVTLRMFRDSGYAEEDLPRLLDESQGYPFLVALLCEAKGGSVSFYKQFYDRTTRWMTASQKNWVLPFCYLDRITEGSVAKMIGDDHARLAMDWFMNEASLRDPHAEWYVISPYIRRTLLEYHLRMIGEEKQQIFIELGRRASGSLPVANY